MGVVRGFGVGGDGCPVLADHAIKIALEDQLRGYGIEMFFCAAAIEAAGAESFLRIERRKSLLGKIDTETEATAQLVGEASAARGHRVWRAVKQGRMTHDQMGWPPFADQGRNRRKTLGVGFAMNRRQRVRLPQLPFTNGNADTLLTEVEREYRTCLRAGWLRHALLHRQGWSD